MNKKQLAAKIWESANNLRGKMEANEYKDYILGFIFYKFLSDNEVSFLKKAHYSDEDIKNLTEEDKEQVKYIQENFGYFISYENLFQYWIEIGNDFTVDNVIIGL
ncbi:type I restriction-modification system subunit M N-terminal domain-containing protein [Listeria marthii]|nr:type I restriction-modification system subunit M N-terminal domain-containing protein [Listeria marthii]